MWQYEKIDVSEGIGINKANLTEECLLCHYWYFKYVGYKLEPHVGNKCHDLLMTAYELKKNITILDAKDFDYTCNLCGISKNEAVNILNNSVLENNGVL